MFELFKGTTPIRFMKYSKPATWLSMLLIVGSIASLSINWINWGLDFTGGTLIEVGFDQPAVLPDVRETLAESNFPGAIVQHFGSSHEVMIRIAPKDGVKGVVIGNTSIGSVTSS